MEKTTVAGLMSGSSLDGLDVAIVDFTFDGNRLLDWKLLYADTFPIPFGLQNSLESPIKLSISDRSQLEKDLTEYFIEVLKDMPFDTDKIALIGSHGHTILHHPDKKRSIQLGNNTTISQFFNTPVVGQFRQEDMDAGGTGTPMAPIADRDLFPGYDMYLNIGGIANVSFLNGDQWNAFDIAPANQVMNYFADKLGEKYDDKGHIARSGNLHKPSFDFLFNHPYVSKEFPKSLDNTEVMEEWVMPLQTLSESTADTLYTFTEFSALLIQRIFGLTLSVNGTLFITGGGAHNEYLLERIQFHNPGLKLELVSDQIIDFKEAILIAYAAILKQKQIPNFISSVTGASHDVVGGKIYA